MDIESGFSNSAKGKTDENEGIEKRTIKKRGNASRFILPPFSHYKKWALYIQIKKRLRTGRPVSYKYIPRRISTADPVKITVQSLKGRNLILNPVKRDIRLIPVSIATETQ